MPTIPPLQTGQNICYDSSGKAIPCPSSGQDGEFSSGLAWPTRRFTVEAESVRDHLTGLSWARNANLAGFPLTWQESLDFIARMNADQALGHTDWRLPNRHELRSLMSYQARKPALAPDHPFRDVFLGWYWTSTTAAIEPRYAWYIHLEGARMFYGRKDQYSLLWPVRGQGNGVLPVTGQQTAYDEKGAPMQAGGTGQDGELQIGAAWPTPRYSDQGDYVIDRLTNLCWTKEADLTSAPLDWQGALTAIRELNRRRLGAMDTWRLPDINALASLVDCSRHSPALPETAPFTKVRDTYWSSTSSFFETDWAWALYLTKGALGVGHKKSAAFHVWAVSPAPPEK